MLINLFHTVRSAGVPCTLRELLDLLGALEKNLAFADMEDFYFLSRTILVKDEKNYDKFDRAFESYFKGIENLEDIFEALIGAIYLDTKNYSMVEKFIIHVIEKFVDFTDILMIDNNYKDQISRYFQRNYNDGSRPIYKHTKEDDIFYCELYHKDKLLIKGEGMSKKKSEQDVSKKALIYFNVITNK